MTLPTHVESVTIYKYLTSVFLEWPQRCMMASTPLTSLLFKSYPSSALSDSRSRSAQILAHLNMASSSSSFLTICATLSFFLSCLKGFFHRLIRSMVVRISSCFLRASGAIFCRRTKVRAVIRRSHFQMRPLGPVPARLHCSRYSSIFEPSRRWSSENDFEANLSWVGFIAVKLDWQTVPTSGPSRHRLRSGSPHALCDSVPRRPGATVKAGKFLVPVWAFTSSS